MIHGNPAEVRLPQQRLEGGIHDRGQDIKIALKSEGQTPEGRFNLRIIGFQHGEQLGTDTVTSEVLLGIGGIFQRDQAAVCTADSNFGPPGAQKRTNQRNLGVPVWENSPPAHGPQTIETAAAQ